MTSTLVIDSASLKAIIGAYIPGSSVAVSADGKLSYEHEDIGFKIALNSLSAGGTVTYSKLKFTIAKLEMADGGVSATFSVK